MKRTLVALALLGAAACKPASNTPPAKWHELSTLDAKAAHGAGALFLDANTDSYREKNGKVPGAVLLSSSSGYDVAATLPADKGKQLVFYCSSRT